MDNLYVILCDRPTLVRYMYWEHGIKPALHLMAEGTHEDSKVSRVPYSGDFQGLTLTNAVDMAQYVAKVSEYQPHTDKPVFGVQVGTHKPGTKTGIICIVI